MKIAPEWKDELCYTTDADQMPIQAAQTAFCAVVEALTQLRFAVTGTERFDPALASFKSIRQASLSECLRDMRPMLAEIERLLKRIDG